MATAAKLSKSGRFSIFGDLQTRMPPVTKGLVAHFPFDGTLKPTPVAEFNYDNVNVDSVHPTHPDLFKVVSPGQVVTIPGLSTAKFVVVEFDVVTGATMTGSGMFLAFLSGSGGNATDIFLNSGKLGLNSWDSTTYGANLPLNKRTRVTVVLDQTVAANSKIYFDGVAQTMVGTAHGLRAFGGTVVLGNGTTANTTYYQKEFWGNLKIYTVNEAAVQGYGVQLDPISGAFVGQPSTNMLANGNGELGDTWWVAASGAKFAWDAEKGSFVNNPNAPAYAYVTRSPYLPAVAGETYTFSFLMKGRAWNARIYFLNSGNGQVGVSDELVLRAQDGKQDDQFRRFSVTGTAPATTTQVYVRFDTYQRANELRELQLEKGFGYTPYKLGSGGAAGAYLKFQAHLASDHTLLSSARHTLDNTEKLTAITKSGTTFTVYENGEDVTSSRQNKWRIWTYHRPSVNYTMTTAMDNLKALHLGDATDFTGVYRSQSADKAGTHWRTYVYADADVRLWWRFAADNGGQIRVNGRDTQSLGSWDANVNPDVYVDLKTGWNVVEIWGMDGDAGGTVNLATQHTGGLNENLTTSTNKEPIVKLSEHPNVKFMTSEAPLDYLNGTDGGGFTHGFQKVLHELSIYDRALSVGEVQKFTRSMLTLNPEGDLFEDVIEEEENLWPDPEMNSIDYGIWNANAPKPTIRFDDGKYHQVVLNNTIWSYKGYTIAGEAGATYVFSAEVWKSAGATLTGPGAIQTEGHAEGSDGPVLWSSIPNETWTFVEKKFVSDGAVNCFPVYPSNATPGTGTVKWRKVCIRKLPSKAMSASPTVVKVGEIVEA